ncbi:unnamed protein product [Adineta steineri]|uniref:Aminoglycoside phosphotransferase domain-containing protein n=1 Tax=Adineta steineri TaxID=433720 RepID=A0A814IPG5_9BILA|nr:unnamed protein product [Adineta steineri]
MALSKELIFKELSLILMKYSLGKLSSSIEQITDGWTNLTYKFQMESNGKFYILRIYHSDREENIQVELNFISYLYNQIHLPVVPSIDPPGIFLLANQYYCVIFPFIDGIKYINTPQNYLRQLWQTLEISRFPGQLHSINNENTVSICNYRVINIVDTKYQLINSCDKFQKDYQDLYKRIRKIIDECTSMIPVIENEFEQIIFERNLEKKLPKGFIHVDIHDENVLFDREQNKIAAVLDFNDISFGPFLIDIAMTLCFWCSCGPKFNTDYAKQFLIEYQQTRKMSLTNDEWNLLELYCYMTIFHQILFIIQLQDNEKIINEMINELLLPIEEISQNKTFLRDIR